MMFWIYLGLVLAVPSLGMMLYRAVRGEKHTDNDFTKLLDWPLLVTGVLMVIPTMVWWDFIVGVAAMIVWEVYKFAQAKRKHAEHDLATATAAKEKSA